MKYSSEGARRPSIDFTHNCSTRDRRGSNSSSEDTLQVREAKVLSTTSAPLAPLPMVRGGIAQQPSPTLTASSPRAGLPAGLTIPVACRVGSNNSTVSSANVSGRRLSFDVPPTPESAYVGGSSASNYSFGMPMTMPTILPYGYQPMATMGTTIPEMNVFGTQTMPSSMMTGSGSPKARVIGTTMSTAPVSTSSPYNPLVANGNYGYFPQQHQQQSSGNYYYMPPAPTQGTTVGISEGTVTSTVPFLNGGTFDPVMQQRLDLGTLVPGGGMSTSLADTQRPGMITTVMLRNIPLKYNREALLGDMDNRGFAFTYDFFYLPIDFHTGNNVGYAFINFLDEDTVNRFKANYDGLQLSADSAKICQVSEAKAQGKLKNIEQYRNSSVMNMEDKYQPVVFESGVRKPFPPPTRTLKPVKPRARAG